jgi:hypothetical protein
LPAWSGCSQGPGGGAEIVADADIAFSRSAIDGYALADGSPRISVIERRDQAAFRLGSAAEEAIRISPGSAAGFSVGPHDRRHPRCPQTVVTRLTRACEVKGVAKNGGRSSSSRGDRNPGRGGGSASVGVTELPVPRCTDRASCNWERTWTRAHSRRPALFAIATPRWLPPSWRSRGWRGYLRAVPGERQQAVRAGARAGRFAVGHGGASVEPTMARSKFNSPDRRSLLKSKEPSRL